jgi:type IV pilus assembly protein PilN
MIRINLLAEAKPTKKKRGVAAMGGAGRLNVVLLASALVVGLLAIFIQYWILNTQIKELDEKIRIAQAEVKRLEPILKEVKDFEDKKAKLQKKVDLINQLKQNQKGPVRLMDEISKALPDLLWLERLDYHGNGISLTGKALNPPAVANFLENLKRVSSFQEPKVQDISACGAGSQGSVYCFSMSFVFANLDKTQMDAVPPAAAGGAGAGADGKTTPATPGGPPKAEGPRQEPAGDASSTALAAGM